MTAPDPYVRENSDRAVVKTSLVTIPVSFEGRDWHVAGELREPTPIPETRRPALLLVHGSGGVDSRSETYAFALNKAGIVTLEIDLWAARGVRTPQERPKTVAETMPDAFAALAFLSSRKEVDPKRIGIMGFSWGGLVSMMSATKRAIATFAKDGQQFAAHAPLYPVCWIYNSRPGFEIVEMTGAPIFIQTGAEDRYDDPDACERLVASLPDNVRSHVSFATYPGASHAWDRKEPDIMAKDPFGFKGKGGDVPLHYNADITRQSTEATVAFFTRTLVSS